MVLSAAGAAQSSGAAQSYVNRILTAAGHGASAGAAAPWRLLQAVAAAWSNSYGAAPGVRRFFVAAHGAGHSSSIPKAAPVRNMIATAAGQSYSEGRAGARKVYNVEAHSLAHSLGTATAVWKVRAGGATHSTGQAAPTMAHQPEGHGLGGTSTGRATGDRLLKGSTTKPRPPMFGPGYLKPGCSRGSAKAVIIRRASAGGGHTSWGTAAAKTGRTPTHGGGGTRMDRTPGLVREAQRARALAAVGAGAATDGGYGTAVTTGAGRADVDGGPGQAH